MEYDKINEHFEKILTDGLKVIAGELSLYYEEWKNEKMSVGPQKSRQTCMKIQDQPVEAVDSFTHLESIQ